jgi:hypothetical protein
MPVPMMRMRAQAMGRRPRFPWSRAPRRSRSPYP